VISIIIPTLNAAAGLKRSLPALVAGVEAGLVRELIIADAGSTDATIAIADAAGATIVNSAMGEGSQSIAGALAARGSWLLFLHAAAALQSGWTEEVASVIAQDGAQACVFRIDTGARIADTWANLRASWLKAAPRTHGLLIARALYDAVGGYAAAPGAHRELLARLGAGRLRALRTRAALRAL
jgi:glycosyltransferase involved in cell wall biosynthesis